MDPLTLLSIADGIVALLEKVAPDIAQAFQSGQITPEQQAALMNRIAALGPGGSAFSGPEWTKSTATPTVPPTPPPAA